MKAVSNSCRTLWALLLLFLLVPGTGQALAGMDTASTPLKVGREESLSPVHHITVLEDPQGTLTYEDVLRPEHSGRFHPTSKGHLNFRLTSSTFWLKFDMEYPAHKRYGTAPVRTFMLEIMRSQLKLAELYARDASGHVTRLRSDASQPISERAVKYPNSVFPLQIKRGETITVHLRVANDSALFLPMGLWTQEAFPRHVAIQNLLFSMFYGGMLVIIVYNLFLFVSVRDSIYFYYGCYLCSAFIFEIAEFGHLDAYFDLPGDVLGKTYLPFWIWMGWLSGLKFTEAFLRVRQRSPLIHAFFNPLYIFAITSTIIGMLLPFEDALLGGAILAGQGSWLALILGGYFWYRYRDINAAWFTIAWTFNVGGFVALSLTALDVLPPSPWIIALMPLGTWIEAALLAFALGERIKRTQREVISARQRSITHLARYRSLFENAMEGIYRMTPDGRLLSANNAMARILGFANPAQLMANSRQVVGQLYASPEDWKTLLGKHTLHKELPEFTRDGNRCNVVHSAQLLPDRDGTPGWIEGVLVDITERHHHEQAQRALVKERHEREMATQATQHKSRFLKDMSFQIRTPLNAIIGFSEALRDRTQEITERRKTIDAVNRNAQSLLQLVNDILDISKIEAGKMTLESIPVELVSLLEDVQATFRPQAEAKGLRFSVDYRFPLPANVITDPTRLRQILQNLCSNAIKYTKDGRIRITVRWDGLLQRLILEVEDNGIGLTDQEVAALLDDAPEAQDTLQGSGLGLRITRHLTRLLGGTLEIESRKHSGTRITAAIACRVAAHKGWVENAPVSTRKQANVTPIGLRGRVLLAEDNPVNQKLITRLLEKAGATVTLAINGREALEAASASRFDLILMDVNMPEMDGLSATRALRNARYEGAIYALTAEQSHEEIQVCLSAGCNGHLAKPVDIQAFHDVLREHLQTRPPTTGSG